jgi:hypothetical protein
MKGANSDADEYAKSDDDDTDDDGDANDRAKWLAHS